MRRKSNGKLGSSQRPSGSIVRKRLRFPRREVGFRFKIIESVFDGFGVSVADENTENFTVVTTVFENFIN